MINAKNIGAISEETIDLARKALSNPTSDAALAKDATTQGYTTATGITGYDLEAPAKSLFPVLAPFRNSVSRVKAPIGSQNAHWKGIMGINTTNVRATTNFGYAGGMISTREQDFMAAYKVLSLGDTVQYDAQIQAQAYQDLRATAGVNLLYALMMQEDVVLLGGQNFTLGTPVAPTLVVGSSGSIGAINMGVAVAARTMQGYFDGQGTIVSPTQATGSMTGSVNSVTATATAVPGAVCYDWFVGTNGGTLYYYGTTLVNKITITSNPGVAAATTGIAQCSVPTYWSGGSNENGTLTTMTVSTQATVDNSIDPNAPNGVIASLVGGYNGGTFVQNGTGTASGSYVASLNGATMTGSNGTIAEIDAALSYLWGNAKLSPTKILMNATDHLNASNKMLATSGGTVFFRPNDLAERQEVIGGQLVVTYMNKFVNGIGIPMETHPWLPQGTIILLTERLPYPNNKVANVMEVETQLEYTQIEYATARLSGTANGGPRYDFEVRAQEAFKNYFPGSMAIIQNVANG